MAKSTTQFVCQSCGFKTPRWMGRCPECSEWNTMIEETVRAAPSSLAAQIKQGGFGAKPARFVPDVSMEGPPEERAERSGGGGLPAKLSYMGAAASGPRRITDIAAMEGVRPSTMIGEFDRVLGGGVVPGSLVLIGGDPGIGKCLTGDQRVLDPHTGDYLPITAWRDSERVVAALNEATGQISCAAVEAFLEQGVKPIVKVTTRLGRTLRCTATHPLLTADGWRAVGDLRVGDQIASPRCLPFFGDSPTMFHEVKLLAFALSSGSAQRAADRWVPPCLFRLPKEQMRVFLRTLFTADGSLVCDEGGTPLVSYPTDSRRLAEDVQHLLLRFGFVAALRALTPLPPLSQAKEGESKISIRFRQRQHDGTTGTPSLACERGGRGVSAPEIPDSLSPAFEIQLLGVGEVRRFVKEIGIEGQDEAKERLAALPFAPLPSEKVFGANDNIYWDEIVRIEPDGEEPVFDLSVPGPANFVASDLIVHNSTLLTQVAGNVARAHGPTLYISGEESTEQIKLRATRLGAEHEDLLLASETDVAQVASYVQQIRPSYLIIDSIQTMQSPDVDSAPGTVSQVRASCAALAAIAKGMSIPVFLVGHVTKEGAIAGPRVLEHMVDTVLYFEGDRHLTYRILRAVKNRFGSTDELGIFEMREEGLVGVENPSELFLAERANGPGSTITATIEGTRPLLVEIQALVAPSYLTSPRRTTNGVDRDRVALILAVLEKRVGLKLGNQDVYVNVAGGIDVKEPSADLAIALAIASNFMEMPADPQCVLIGEVGLAGEVRGCSQIEKRLKEASRLGFGRALIANKNIGRDSKVSGMNVAGIETVAEAVKQALVG